MFEMSSTTRGLELLGPIATGWIGPPIVYWTGVGI